MHQDAPFLTRQSVTSANAQSAGRPLVRTNASVESVPYLHSVIPQNRLNFLVETCRQALMRCPGNVLEVGVYRGGSLSRLAQVVQEICPQYRAFGIDTFSGHPYSDGHPVHPQGKYSDVDLSLLRASFDEQVYGSWVELRMGRVEDILNRLSLRDIAFAHIDCDLYLPVRYCAERVPALMTEGGSLYFDDYGHDHCPGATKAVLETFPQGRIHDVIMPEDGTCWSCYVQLDEQA